MTDYQLDLTRDFFYKLAYQLNDNPKCHYPGMARSLVHLEHLLKRRTDEERKARFEAMLDLAIAHLKRKGLEHDREALRKAIIHSVGNR